MTQSNHTEQLLSALNQPIQSIRIGFIGMGLMGIPMSQRLHAAGLNLQVWNRDTDKMDCPQLGEIHKAVSAKALVNDVDVIMLCVSNTAAVEDLLYGEAAIAQHLRSNQVVIDFSSIAPETTRSIASKLMCSCGTTWIDSPVSGGVTGAETGSLAIMTGGPKDVLEALTPLLKPLANRITRMGEVGSGQTTKVCNQMLVCSNIAVMAEVLALAEKAGVDADLIPTALKGGFADSLPLQITGKRMAQRELDEVKWTVKTLIKDLQLAESLSIEHRADTPMSKLANSILDAHGDSGFLESDPATLIKHYID